MGGGIHRSPAAACRNGTTPGLLISTAIIGGIFYALTDFELVICPLRDPWRKICSEHPEIAAAVEAIDQTRNNESS